MPIFQKLIKTMRKADKADEADAFTGPKDGCVWLGGGFTTIFFKNIVMHIMILITKLS